MLLIKNTLNRIFHSGNSKSCHLQSVTCANGSKLKINGSIVLDVQIGPKVKLIHFLVAESLFSSVIIGLHGMKSLGLKVDLEKSSVFVHDIQINIYFKD